ncbi:pentatricopeptide repeat-containing protein At1g10270-like [Cicer arietinum]|uniref:Pentatricopeptide repeat-containing protein At1g10270-like n=1 Tax=Cicer arietinum TaxID=3827 RepID=A0A1S2YEZ7_CICAR|nr:pentatricopeptide repeat-containing protein At1g10270-like [Cicer arietinum]
MSLCRLLLRSLRRSTTVSPISITVRSFAFSSAEEAAAVRRQRKRRLRIEPPLNAIRPPPQQHHSRDPNAPRLPDSTSALVGPRLNLHNRVQSLIRAGDLDAASAIARHSVFSMTRPTVFTCNAIIAAMYRAKRYNEAIALFHFFFNQSNLVPNIVSYNNVINTHCDEGRVDVALEIYRHIIANAPFSPSPVTYRHLTKGLINTGRIDEAVDLLREMLTKGHGADSLVYNNLILGFLELGNLDKANELFDELKERCLVYDGVVNATYMEWFFNQGRDKEAIDSYKSLMAREFRMTPATCNVLLEVLLKHGKKTEAWALFDQMLDNHTPPNFQAVNSDTFNVMVNECYKLGRVDEAVATFRKVGTKPNSKPFVMDVAGYRNIISRMCENEMLSEAETMFQELCSKSLSPDVPTHTVLIDGYLKVDRIDDALRIFNKMVDAGLRVVATFGNRVFDELIKNGKAIDCAQILSKMGEKDPKPDPSCYEVVIKGLCAEGLLDKSQELLDEVMRYGVGLTSALRELVTEAFKNAGRGEEIERLLDMNRVGYNRPRPAYQQRPPPPTRSPSQMAGTYNPTNGFPQQRPPPQYQTPPSQVAPQQYQTPPSQVAGTHNPSSVFPSQMTAPQQYQTPPSQVAGTHNPSSVFPSQMTAPQQYQTLPSQVAGTHNNPSSGFPAHTAGHNPPPHYDTRMAGGHNYRFPSGYPPQNSGQQRPPLHPQTTGTHQAPWGVSPPMTGLRGPAAGPSPQSTGQPHHPPYEHPPHMERVSPQTTANPNTPYRPSTQFVGHQPYGPPSRPQQMAEQPYPPSRLTTPMSGQHHPSSGPTPPMSGSSQSSYGSSAETSMPYYTAPGTSSQITRPYHPSSGTPPHFEESHQQQSEVPEQVAVYR